MEKQRPIRSKRRTVDVNPEGFDVTFEINIGFVSLGTGDDNPIAAAMHLIGDHMWRSDPDMGGVYHFPGPGEDQIIRVEVST